MFANKTVFLKVCILGSLVLCSAAASAQQVPAAEPGVPADLAVNAPTLAAPTAARPAVPAAPIVMRNSVSAGKIAEINERMSVMQATLAELELQVKIVAKNEEIRRLNAGPLPTDDGFTPSVVEIGGMDGKLTANLQMQGGNLQTVRVGDKLGGWLIKAITIDSLTMARGKETKRLAFGTAIATPASTGTMPMPGNSLQAPLPMMR